MPQIKDMNTSYMKAAIVTMVLMLVTFIALFLGFWLGDPPLVQASDVIDDTNNQFNSTDKTDAQRLENKYNIKICKKCSMDGGKFIGFTMLFTSIVFIIGMTVTLVLYKKNKGKGSIVSGGSTGRSGISENLKSEILGGFKHLSESQFSRAADSEIKRLFLDY
jgi:hypothetical protein